MADAGPADPVQESALAQHGPYAEIAAQQPVLRVSLPRNDDGSIGLALGGGAPHCPCIYITAVRRGTVTTPLDETPPPPPRSPGEIECGDEIVSINGSAVAGKTMEEVQELLVGSEPIALAIRPLPEQIPSKDSVLLKANVTKSKFQRLFSDKLRLSKFVTDALGIYRVDLKGEAVAVFKKRIENFEKTRQMYQQLVKRTKKYLEELDGLVHVQGELGDFLGIVAGNEVDASLHTRLSAITSSHKSLQAALANMKQPAEFVCGQMQTFLDKAIPDAKLTQQAYEKARSKYLAHCVVIHEFSDRQDYASATSQTLKRMSTGNYIFRFALRETLRARAVHDRLKADLEIKLDLLDSKHARDICDQLSRLTAALAEYYERGHEAGMAAVQEMAQATDVSAEQCRAIGLDPSTTT